MKRKQIEDELRQMIRSFLAAHCQHVDARDVSEFLHEINPRLQEYAHEKISGGGIVNHVDRICFKDSLRLFILKEIGKIYHQAVIEYLWFSFVRLRRDREYESEVTA